MKTKDLIVEAISLPVEDRAIIVDSIPKSLNLPELGIDKKWAVVAKRRLSELRSGDVKAILGNEVFNKVSLKLGTATVFVKRCLSRYCMVGQATDVYLVTFTTTLS